MQNKSIESLLLEYKAASEVAFNEFYTRTRKTVYNFLYFRLRKKEEADECFQETYLRIHKYIYTYDPSKSAINWVLSIASNVLNDKFAMINKNQILSDGKNVDETDPRSYLKSDFIETLREIDPLLSEESIEILTHKFFDDWDYSDFASHKNISEVNARKKISRLLQMLREKSLSKRNKKS